MTAQEEQQAEKGRLVPDHGSGPIEVYPRPKRYWLADPDETEGRALYRGQANARARMDLAMARHKFSRKDQHNGTD